MMKHWTPLCALVAASALGCSSADSHGYAVTPSGDDGSDAGSDDAGTDASVGTGTGESDASAGGTKGGADSGSSTSHPTIGADAGSGGHSGDAGAVTQCPAAPSGAPSNAVQAWMVVNKTRVAAGSGCMNLVTALDTSAQAHCNYDATNSSNASCIPDAHTEVKTCTGFTGVDVQSREVAAGYPQTLAYTEVATTFGNNPTAAVPNWIDTVFHRIPVLDPWTVDMGYGGATGCDVIDIGRGMSSVPASTIVTYPYDGQTNVPSAWSGLEGPAPPAPSGGFPSSYPINIYAQGLSVTQHVLTKDGDSTPIDHLWLDANSSQISSGLKGYFVDTGFLYGAPFELSTKYHVKIVGTHSGGTLNVEWSFTTGATRPLGT